MEAKHHPDFGPPEAAGRDLLRALDVALLVTVIGTLAVIWRVAEAMT